MRLVAALAVVLLCACGDSVPVLVTVPNAGVEASIVRPWWRSKKLGTGPFTRAAGAQVGDTIRLRDGARTTWEIIQFGEPLGERVIQMR